LGILRNDQESFKALKDDSKSIQILRKGVIYNAKEDYHDSLPAILHNGFTFFNRIVQSISIYICNVTTFTIRIIALDITSISEVTLVIGV